MDAGKGDDCGRRCKGVFTSNTTNVTCLWSDDIGEANMGGSIWGVRSKSHGKFSVKFKHVSLNRGLLINACHGP